MLERQPYRVLLVDDGAELRGLLRTRLAMEPDIEIVGEGSNGVEAVRLTKSLTPTAVILDMQMPVMTGVEAIPLLREAAPEMGILLFTAVEDANLPEESMPDVTVRKGVPLGVVVTRLRELFVREPFDVLRLDLGSLPLGQAITAFDTWTGLNLRVLEALERGDVLFGDQLSGASREELEALMGVYAHIGQTLQRAARAGDEAVTPVIHLFRTSAVLARGALLAFNNHRLEGFWNAWGYDVPDDAVTALTVMRDRLMAVLPASVGFGRSEATDVANPKPGSGVSDLAASPPGIHPGDDRDRSADARDERADAHDVVSEARDLRAEARDQRAVRRDQSAVAVDAGAVADRAAALRDRRGGAGDRVQAYDDRRAASADRTLAAEERADASIDQVTGVSSRKEGMVALSRDLDRAIRTKKPFTLAFIDVDNLKDRNDTLGHLAGDKLLRHTAEVIQAHLRSYDLVIRFGGDEFLCGLVDVPIAEAAKRFGSANDDLLAQEGASFSLGLAELRGGDALSDLIARADTAMYAAKAIPARTRPAIAIVPEAGSA